MFSEVSAITLFIFSFFLYLKMPVSVICLVVGAYGFLVCPIVPIVMEEFIVLLDPKYLLTGSVTIRMAGAFYSTLVTYGVSSFLNVKTVSKGRITCMTFSITYLLVVILALIAVPVYKKRVKYESKESKKVIADVSMIDDDFTS